MRIHQCMMNKDNMFTQTQITFCLLDNCAVCLSFSSLLFSIEYMPVVALTFCYNLKKGKNSKTQMINT
jgi:hypothetical protein